MSGTSVAPSPHSHSEASIDVDLSPISDSKIGKPTPVAQSSTLLPYLTSFPVAAVAHDVALRSGLPQGLARLAIEYALHHAELKTGTVLPDREVRLNSRTTQIEARFKQLGGSDEVLQFARNLGVEFSSENSHQSAISRESLDQAFNTIVSDRFVAIIRENNIGSSSRETYPATESQDAFANQRRINQKHPWDCGPTATAIALAPFVGVPPEVLADSFRRIQRSGRMDWDNPQQFVKYVNQKYGTNIRIVVQADLSAKELADFRSRGCTAIISASGYITNGGHITALGAVQPRGDSFAMANLDPNGRNIARGKTMLSEKLINRYSKQAWVFTAA